MKLSCIIVEDEPLASDKLNAFIEKVPFLELLERFENPVNALAYLNQAKADILFLDIEMEQLNGLKLLETLHQKPYIIITSAYSEYALKGYELCVFDYLLKPYSFDRFLAAVNRVYNDILEKQKSTGPYTHIFVKTEYRRENIKVDEILCVQGMREYLQIQLPDRKIMTKMSFKTLLDMLPVTNFAMVHKSWVIALSKIESIERNRIKIGDNIIPIGDSYKEEFWKRIE